MQVYEVQSENDQGWKRLLNAKKRHFFHENGSLCGRFTTFNMTGLDRIDEQQNNCVECKRRLARRDA